MLTKTLCRLKSRLDFNEKNEGDPGTIWYHSVSSIARKQGHAVLGFFLN